MALLFYAKVPVGLEVGQNLIDHVYCTNTSVPEHEAVPLSHKTCLQIEAATFS